MRVDELLIYPVKSCAGVKVQEARVTKYGLAYPIDPRIFDRRWMVVKNGRHQSQRVFPRMALIQPSFVANGLRLQAPGMPNLLIPLETLPTETMECLCWDEPVRGLRYGSDCSQWFQTFLQSDDELHLVVFDDAQFDGRPCKNSPIPNVARDGDRAAYHDMSPLHLCSTKSVADLNARLQQPVEVYNFRPNIVVADVEQPFAEDCWREIEIGGVKLTWITACPRCLLPTVNPKTGVKDPKQEPWKTLRSYRRKPEIYGVDALFGIDLAPTDDQSDTSGIIRVGDQVRVNRDDPDFWNKSRIDE